MKTSLPSLRAIKIGKATRIDYEDVLKLAGRDPATVPADHPKVVSIRTAMEILQISRATVNRMLVRGRAAAAA